MKLTVVTPATTYPVTLDEVKASARIETGAENTLLEDYIASASALVEDITGWSLMSRTLRLTLDGFADEIELPGSPAIAVSGVTYIDPAGAQQTLAAAVYVLDLVSNPALLVLDAAQVWPQTKDTVNTVAITYTAGHADAASVPAPLRQAIRMIVTDWYDNRTPGEIPAGAMRLLERYRTQWVAA